MWPPGPGSASPRWRNGWRACGRQRHRGDRRSAYRGARRAERGGEGLLSHGLLIFALVSLLVAALVIYNSFRILLAARLRKSRYCVASARAAARSWRTSSPNQRCSGWRPASAGSASVPLLAAVVNSGSVSLTAGHGGVPGDRHRRHGRRRAAARAGGVPDRAGRRADARSTGQGRPPEDAGHRRGPARRRRARAHRRGIPRGKTGLFVVAAGGTIFFLGFLVAGRCSPVRWRLCSAGCRRACSACGCAWRHRRAPQPSADRDHHRGPDHRDRADDPVRRRAIHRKPVRHPRDEPALPRRLPAVGEAGRNPGAVGKPAAKFRIAVAVGVREGGVSLDGHQVQLLAAEPAAYRSVYHAAAAFRRRCPRVETGTGGIALPAPRPAPCT